MGSGSLRQERDKTAFESLQAAADHSLIKNPPLDDVTSWSPATRKGMSVWEGQKNTVISSTACAPAPALPLGSFPERVNQYRSGSLFKSP